MVVVPLEIEELHLQIRGRPEQGAVQTFAPHGANQPFNEGMGERHVRHGLDVPDVEDAQIRLPLANRYRGSWSELRYVGEDWPRVARLNIRHSPAPSTTPRCTAKPTMRRVQWSITTSTQYVRRTADSHRNKSRLHRLSFV